MGKVNLMAVADIERQKISRARAKVQTPAQMLDEKIDRALHHLAQAKL